MHLRLAGLAAVCLGAKPIARHLTVVVIPGEDAVISLRGYDTDGDKLSASVASLPSSGTLSQLSNVFSKYAYDPKKGVAVTSAAKVTGSSNRVYYQRPTYDTELSSGKWGTFTYTVSDAAATSRLATVTLVGPSRKTVASAFDDGAEGWTVVRNGDAVAPAASFDASSFGTGLNRFIIATDELISRDGATGLERNSSRWMFAAPAAYAGNQGSAYGGSLQFTLGALAGDLSGDLSRNYNFVEIECASCDVNEGATIAMPLSATTGFDGSTKSFSISLDEAAGWILDPKNSLMRWAAPTKCQFIEILSGITNLRILGDFTDWYESIALDAVALVAPTSGTNLVPICAQYTPDASTCTCDD